GSSPAPGIAWLSERSPAGPGGVASGATNGPHRSAARIGGTAGSVTTPTPTRRARRELCEPRLGLRRGLLGEHTKRDVGLSVLGGRAVGVLFQRPCQVVYACRELAHLGGGRPHAQVADPSGFLPLERQVPADFHPAAQCLFVAFEQDTLELRMCRLQLGAFAVRSI